MTHTPQYTPPGWAPERYIAQAEACKLLEEVSRKIEAPDAHCYVYYLQANGGMGKSRLLQEYSRVTRVPRESKIRVARIIDMTDIENRTPVNLERKLIMAFDEQRTDDPKLGIERTLIKEVLRKYDKARDAFRLAQEDPKSSQEKEGTNPDQTRKGTFIDLWNELSTQYPLVIRLDTLEALFLQAPPANVFPRNVHDSDLGSSASILNWMSEVLPQLKRTLVLFAGRPVESGKRIEPENWLITALRKAEHVTFHLVTLRPFMEPGEFDHFLKDYGVTVGPGYSYLQRITGGTPLLLTLYAWSQSPATKAALVPVGLDKVNTRSEFEQGVAATILNLTNLVDELDPSERNDRLVTTLCFYILAIGRRGLRISELRAILQTIQEQTNFGQPLELTDALAETLRDPRYSPIRVIPIWHLGSLTDGEPLLRLHDEIERILDVYGNVRTLGIYEMVLEKIIELRRTPVDKQRTEKGMHGQPSSDLRAMSDHVYYTLTRRYAEGYRLYLTYMTRLLAQRSPYALMLAESFWQLMATTADRLPGRVQTYLDRLAEELLLAPALIDYYNTFHYIRFLIAEGKQHYPKAIEEIDKLYKHLAEFDVVPDYTEDEGKLEFTNTQPNEPLLFVELLLAWSNVLLLSEPAGYITKLESIHTAITALLGELEGTEQLEVGLQASSRANQRRDEDFIRLRRCDLLAQVERDRGRLKRAGLRFDEAIQAYERALEYLEAYNTKEVKITPLHTEEKGKESASKYLSDQEVLAEEAFIRNNLAYVAALNGDFYQAERQESILAKYLERLEPYTQALILNAHARILMLQSRYQDAEEKLVRVSEILGDNDNLRAKALFNHARGILARWKMNDGDGKSNSTEDSLFKTAAVSFNEEPLNLREVCQDWARYLRDRAFFKHREGDSNGAKGDLKEASDKIQAALGALDKKQEGAPDPDLTRQQQVLPRADLHKCLAGIHNNQARFFESVRFTEVEQTIEEAETLLKAADKLPRSVHVICAGLALQRGFLHLYRTPPKNTSREAEVKQALYWFAIAMARAAVFSSETTDRQVMARLVRKWIVEELKRTDLGPFLEQLDTELRRVSIDQLQYQNDEQILPPSQWAVAWAQSITTFPTLDNEWARFENMDAQVREAQACWCDFEERPDESVTLVRFIAVVKPLGQSLPKEIRTAKGNMLPKPWEELRDTIVELESKANFGDKLETWDVRLREGALALEDYVTQSDPARYERLTTCRDSIQDAQESSELRRLRDELARKIAQESSELRMLRDELARKTATLIEKIAKALAAG